METAPPCPICTMTDVLANASGQLECMTCGHEWEPEGGADDVGEVRDANGALLQNGDAVVLKATYVKKG